MLLLLKKKDGKRYISPANELPGYVALYKILSPKTKLILPIALILALASSLASAQEGIITTVAGTGTAGFNGDGGPATQAQRCSPATPLPGQNIIIGFPYGWRDYEGFT